MAHFNSAYPHRTIIVNSTKQFANLYTQHSVLKTCTLLLQNCKKLHGLTFTPLFHVNKLIYDKCCPQFMARTLYPWLYHGLTDVFIRMSKTQKLPDTLEPRFYYNESINLFLIGRKKYSDNEYRPNVHYITDTTYSKMLKEVLEDHERDKIVL